ncbi:hypothetical protein CEXT_374811 [Caerostris extrusa]|uniref:Zinc ribbon domain-containing protein n=1 Tax=Caerostris extrusa TaxID=172846 RepID=A0AAV4NBZ8_CAEEX|nr:hypothetical protein CEXT_374811 [Caerostris extrusa]
MFAAEEELIILSIKRRLCDLEKSTRFDIEYEKSTFDPPLRICPKCGRKTKYSLLKPMKTKRQFLNESLTFYRESMLV